MEAIIVEVLHPEDQSVRTTGIFMAMIQTPFEATTGEGVPIRSVVSQALVCMDETREIVLVDLANLRWLTIPSIFSEDDESEEVDEEGNEDESEESDESEEDEGELEQDE